MLVAENSIECFMSKVLNYVSLADSEFFAGLITKGFTAVQPFAPSVHSPQASLANWSHNLALVQAVVSVIGSSSRRTYRPCITE
jgi:hypothetical protein